ncbi:MAG: glycoside hydrolase family 127 protein [Verrucomicrobia bacterium]|nr:glycoside hydrolase family 127 protein [Verrucomicrobiota bacterium]
MKTSDPSASLITFQRLVIVATMSLHVVGGTATAEDRVTVVDRPDVSQKNACYAGNREPLLPSPLIKLPIGSIKPKGWLRKQLELEADGFTGHLTEISGFCHQDGNAWLSPYGEGGASWEEVPYWFRGYAALGYVLDDPKIIAEAKPWIEAAIATQAEFGYFGPTANLNAPIHPPVPVELLTTADGKPGLDAEYFDGVDFKTSKLKRVDAKIDFDWGMKPPIDGLKSTDYSVRWTGRITAKETGDYVFSLYSDDGAKLWIDNVLVVDNGGSHAPLTVTAKQALHLTAGQPHDLKIEYFQGINGAEIRLGWKQPGGTYQPRNIIPDLMPNMNMVYALMFYQEYTGDQRVIDLLKKYFQWQLQIPDRMFFSGGWQVPRNGDNLDAIYWLYNRTGEPFLLELAAKTQRCGESWMGVSTGGHNVQFCQGFRKPAHFYQQNKDPQFLEMPGKNWDSIMGIYGQVPGGTFGGDEFARPGYTDPRQAIETCGCVEMMISEQILTRITGDLKWADRCENAAFNTLPATMTADMKALRYLTSPNQVNSDKRSKAPELADGGPMQVMNPHDHRCCQHNSGAGWPYYADNLWQAAPGNGLAAIFYCASTVKAKVGGGVMVMIDEETHYPFDGNVQFAIAPETPVRFPLYLRVPGWCEKARVTLNGQAVAVQSKPGAYLLIDRMWQPGDRLTLEMPMEIAVTTWTANQNSVSVNRGPLTFSVKIGEEYRRSGGTEAWPAWEIMPTTAWNYALQFDPRKLEASFKVVTKTWPSNNMPFTHQGTPLEIHAQARKLPNWKEDHLGLVDKLQPSPVKSNEPVETVTLIPMGAARLRLAALPVIGTGPDAREWQLPPEPLMSYSRGGPDPYEAMFDGKIPGNSNDPGVPRFTTYCFGGAEHGKLHWVRRNIDQAKSVSSCEVYWVDEASPPGDVRLPKSWRVLHLSGKEWKEVENPSGYGIEPDKSNTVTFKPVKTTALRLDVQCQEGRAMGIYEWQIK